MTYTVYTNTDGSDYTLHKGVKIIQTDNEGSTGYKCSLCIYTSPQRGNVVRHIDRRHRDCVCSVMEGGRKIKMTTPEAIAINAEREKRIAELEAERLAEEARIIAENEAQVLLEKKEREKLENRQYIKLKREKDLERAGQEDIQPDANMSNELNEPSPIKVIKQEEINKVDTIPSPQYSMKFENPTLPPVEAPISPVFRRQDVDEIVQNVADIRDEVCEKEMKQKVDKELKKLMAKKIKTEVENKVKNQLEKKKTQMEMKLQKQMEVKLQKEKDACAKDNQIAAVEKMKEQFASEIKTLSDKVEESIDKCNEDMLLELQNEIQETGDKFAGLMIDFQKMAEQEQLKKAVDKIAKQKGGTRKRRKLTAIEKHNTLIIAGMKKGEYIKVNKTANKRYKRLTKINRKTPKHRN